MKVDRELCKLRLNSGEYRCIFLHNYAHSGWNGYKLHGSLDYSVGEGIVS